MNKVSVSQEIEKSIRYFEERLKTVERIVNSNEKIIRLNNDSFLDNLHQRGLIDKNKRRVFSNNPQDMVEIMQQEQFNLSIMPNIFRHGFVVIVYSLLEMGINEITKIAEKNSKSKIKIKDLASYGSDIDKALNFLKKVIEINLEDINEQWRILNEYRLIRNLIVHHHGSLKYYKEKNSSNTKMISRLEKILNENTQLKEGYDRIVISKEFILDNISVMREFVNKLSDKILKRLDEENTAHNKASTPLS